MTAPTASPAASTAFARQMNGPLRGMLRWPQLDALWLRVREQPQGWFVSQAGEPAPTKPLEADELLRFVTELDALLRREHLHDFCGIVFADDPERPAVVKIYDPHNLGSFCNCSGIPVPTRWVLSRSRPDRIGGEPPGPDGRRQWWRRLLGRREG